MMRRGVEGRQTILCFQVSNARPIATWVHSKTLRAASQQKDLETPCVPETNIECVQVLIDRKWKRAIGIPLASAPRSIYLHLC